VNPRRLGLLLLALLVPAALLLGWLLADAERRRAALARERDALVRALAAHGEEGTEAELARRFAALPWRLVAESPTVAGADAQALVTRRVEAAGGELVSVRVGETEAGPPPRLSLEVRLVAADHRVLRDLLHALEYGRPAFLVDWLEIRGGEEGGVPLAVDLALSLFLADTDPRLEGERGG